MNTIGLAAALLIAIAPTWAAEPAQSRGTTCWYDSTGRLTGATPAGAGATPGTTTHAAGQGDRAWSRTIIGDAAACPAKLPVSSQVSQ